MPFRSYLQSLRVRSECKEISAPVAPELELAAIVNRATSTCTAASNVPLLFTAVDNLPAAILANLYGTPQRIEQILTGVDGVTLPERIAATDKFAIHNIGGVESFAGWLSQQQDFITVKEPDVEMTPLINLDCLPQIKVWPQDAGCYLSMAVVISRSLDGQRISCGLYRLQFHSKTHLTIHWRPGSDGVALFAEYQAAGIAMPIAIVLGGDPVLTYAACFPLPAQVSEYCFATFIKQQPLEVISSAVHGLPVPASCEYLLEGTVSVTHKLDDGPFGNHQGFYSGRVMCPVVDVSRVIARSKPIMPVSIIGPPPTESAVIGSSFMPILLPLLRRDIAQLIDVYMPMETIFHGCALISIEVDGRLPEIIQQLKKCPLLSSSKLLVFVDGSIDVQRPLQVFWRIVNQQDKYPIKIIDGTCIIDATGSYKKGSTMLVADSGIERLVDTRWQEFGFNGKAQGKEL